MKKQLLACAIAGLFVLTGCSNHSGNKKTQTDTNVVPMPVVMAQSATQNKSIQTAQVFKSEVVSPDIYQQQDALEPSVVRTDRYQLTNIDAQLGQKYLLEQAVVIKMKTKKNQSLNVEQGIKNTLSNTGISLCPAFGQSDLLTLYSRPLPKVHQQFGPMKLREALQMLAGPAYQLTLNEQTRVVCFKARVTERVSIPDSSPNE